MMRLFFVMFIGFFVFLSACSSIGTGVEVFSPSDLGENGFPSFSKGTVLSGSKVIPRDDEQYIIRAGDQLSIKFFFNPELNEENLIVRPDGRISLQLVHEIEAANLTAPQLTSLLEKRYSGQVKTPEIAVIVRSVKELPTVYIDGQVESPGVFEIVGSLNVLQVVALAHGFDEDTAKKSEVIVIRRDQQGHSFVIKLDLTAALSGKDLSQNIQLLPNDFVHVPRAFF